MFKILKLSLMWIADSLEGLMLKLKLQYFGHLRWRTDSLEKTLMLGGIGGKRRRGRQRWDGWMVSLTRWTWVWVNSGSWLWTGRPGVLIYGVAKSRTWLSDWTELNWTEYTSWFGFPSSLISKHWIVPVPSSDSLFLCVHSFSESVQLVILQSSSRV